MSSRRTSIIFTIFAAVMWGSAFPVIKWTLAFISPYMLGILQFFFACLVLIPFSFILSWNPLLNYMKTRSIFVLGVINGFSYFFQFIGQNFTAAIQATLLINSSSIFATIFAFIWLDEPISSKKALGVVLAFFGFILITTGGKLGKLWSGQFFGNLICLTSGILWGVYVIISKKTSNLRGRTFFFTLSMMLYTFISITLFSLPFVPSLHPLSLQVWASIIYLGIFCTAVPYLLWLKALKTIEASLSAISLLLMVVVSSFISILVLNEALTSFLVVGSLLICTGVWFTKKY